MHPLVSTGASVPEDSDLCLLIQSFATACIPQSDPWGRSSVVHTMKELR